MQLAAGLKDKTFLLLLIFASVYILGNIYTGSLTTWDEAVYANISKDTLRTGNWFVLYQGTRPWLDKPPLYIWCTAICYKIFGINEFATRLTSSLFGIASVLLIYIFVKKMSNKNTATLAALILSALPHYIHFSKTGFLDITLTFFMILMIYLFWLGQEKARYLMIFWAAFILAYFTKGPAAFLGPVIIFLYCVFSGNIRLLLKKEFIWGGMLAILIISMWYFLQCLLIGPQALQGLTGHFRRIANAVEGHPGGPNFYQKAIFNKNKPWAVLLFASIPYLLWMAVKRKDKRAILISSWVISTYVIYALIKTKLHWYIMPVYPALAISSAFFLERFFRGKAYAFILAVILLGMIIQAPLSWAFKLDFNPDTKNAAEYAGELQKSGFKVYLYSIDDDKEIFYFRDIPFLPSSRDGSIYGSYCIMKNNEFIKEGRSKDTFYIFEKIRTFGPFIFTKIKNKANSN